mmetsp:Transcript_101004/g.159234  ORF Transcript_101004/g.159234 Transcript_101004/m.159234 type:complete len:224 (-) Transcript_101004:131-802(-)
MGCGASAQSRYAADGSMMVGVPTPVEHTIVEEIAMDRVNSKQSTSSATRRASLTEINEPLPEEIAETSATAKLAKRRASKDAKKRQVMAMTCDHDDDVDVYASEPLSPGTKRSAGARMAARRASKGKVGVIRRTTAGREDLHVVKDTLKEKVPEVDCRPGSGASTPTNGSLMMRRMSSKGRSNITCDGTPPMVSRESSKNTAIQRDSREFKENEEPVFVIGQK